jgi:hypothetical protein
MGLIDRLAKAITNNLEKSPNLPVGAVAMTEQQMRAGTNVTNYGTSSGLERNPMTPSVPFSPGMPIIPGAINPNSDRGRPDPRRYEFQVAQNINITETRLVPFKTLRAAADQIDILRRCIEVLKSKITSLEWDISLSEDASEKIIAEIGGSQIQAMDTARDRYTEDINKARQFWEVPDKANGIIFTDWLNMALEEILVLDAWAVWPQKAVNGDLYGLQVLDGSTIKPLIDDRGMRPMPPYPAYQQILYGFPRSEFSAPTETETQDGEFTSDELSYMIKNRRTTTIYGYSPTERALPVADLYLRRQQWLRAEYTDGVTPELMMKTDANFGGNPDLLRRYEDIFNNDLAGQLEQRKRVRLLPAGMEPIQFDGYGERFKETFDEYLVNTICGHFGVMPSEIGFSPKGGLGGAGHQKGQAESGEVIGATPLANWVARMITNLSYLYLGMPRELEFKFTNASREDKESIARANDIELRSGGLTINELRSQNGRSLIESPEADMPIVTVGASAYFISSAGAVAFEVAATLDDNGVPSEVIDQETPAVEAPKPNVGDVKPDAEAPIETDGKAVKEMKAFLKWLRKSPDREFKFEHVEVLYSDVLNKFISEKDFDSARWYAERYLS